MIPLLLILLAADPVPAILSQMDKNAGTFKGATARLKRTNHNAAVDIDITSSGTIGMKRISPKETRALINFTEPAPQQILVAKGAVEVYNPKLQLIQEYDLGKYQGVFEQYFLLGFGGSGKDLEAAYTINSVGNESVNGVATAHLQLIPKSPEIQKQFTKIEIWLTSPAALPAQLRFTTPAGDTNTIVYTDLKMAAPPDSALKLKAPSGVKRQKAS